MDFGALDRCTQTPRLGRELARAGIGRATFEAWLPELPDLCGSRVLDLGCGEGSALTSMSRAVGLAGVAVGLDASRVLLGQASAQRVFGSPLSLLQGRVEALPFPDDCFDLCWCDRVLSHIDRVDYALAEIQRVVRPGGAVFVALYDYAELRWMFPVPQALQEVRDAYVGSVRQPALASDLPRRIEALGLQVRHVERECHQLRRGSDILRACAGVQWLREMLGRGALWPQQLQAAGRSWRELRGGLPAELQVEIVRLLAAKPL